jgi:hypothetical protein
MPPNFPNFSQFGQFLTIFSSYRLGNSYSEIALKGIKDMKYEGINLANNRLEGSQLEEMIHDINVTVKKIDLSKNRLGKEALYLMPHLTQRKSNLKVLNLEKTCLGDKVAIELIEFAKKSITLESLNLSDNRLTDAIAEPLVDTIDNHQTLKEIYLRWNCLTDTFGKTFFGYFNDEEKVSKFNLKVLDLGWNRLGKGLKVIQPAPKKRRRGPPEPELSESIKEFLMNNKTVVHLDLCSNKFRFEECLDIRDGLQKNHSIYGFHFEGNYGYVDSEGFLILDGAVKDFSSEHHTRQIDSINRLDNFHKFQQVNAEDARNVCWICDGWIEMKFEYPRGKHSHNFSKCLTDFRPARGQHCIHPLQTRELSTDLPQKARGR